MTSTDTLVVPPGPLPPLEALQRVHQAAIDLLAAPILAVVDRELRKLLRTATNHALNLTAAGVVDVNALNAVPSQWTEVVINMLLPMYGEVYSAGGVAAFVAESHPATQRVAENVAQAVPSVVPAEAVTYLQGTATRLQSIGDQGWLLTRDALSEGLAQGASIPNLSAAVSDAIHVSTERAATIAQTEVVSACNAGSIASVRQLAAHGGPRFKVWLATGDVRTRATHEAASGQVQPLDLRFKVGGASLDYPGDPVGPPGEIINCRCTLTYTDEPPPGFMDDAGMEDTPPEPIKKAKVQGRTLGREDVEPHLPQGYSAREVSQGYYRGQWSDSGDEMHAILNKAQGFDGLPSVVDDGALSDLLAEGHLEAFRGVTGGHGFANQFQEGDFFPGLGIYGNGTYSAFGRGALGTAQSYASGGEVMRLAYDVENMRIAIYDDLKDTYWAWQNDTSRELDALRQRLYRADQDVADGLLSPEELAALRRREASLEFDLYTFSDPGRYATGQGYDAIAVDFDHGSSAGYVKEDPRTWSEGYMVLLNRTAVSVSEMIR